MDGLHGKVPIWLINDNVTADAVILSSLNDKISSLSPPGLRKVDRKMSQGEAWERSKRGSPGTERGGAQQEKLQSNSRNVNDIELVITRGKIWGGKGPSMEIEEEEER
ncbi:uncharacterized protein MCYG_01303 [Microsporum canis CBS 113480]|uniref:Uncharacterized protein n=1 Tax=Arthroderma otae (strain ATCC MYA-4605 / CBS 113480) TaxID=554155 RepID=C5FEU1_ARTOC|nr:uncharacterized protein MCYG_01303 [Microsporum canis CBS 113480]EEQ28415.1 predicted protein [Microsporum canis CBS 113480]